MSDKVEKSAGSWRLVKRIMLFLGILLLVCGLAALFVFRDSLNMDGLRRWFKYMNVREDGNYGAYSFDSHGSNDYAAFGNGLAVASVGGLDTFDAYGKELAVMQAQLSLPVMEACDDYAMAYDAGGSVLLVTNRGGSEVLRISDETAILDADLAADGSLCYSALAGGYKSVLTVYDNKQSLLYRWMSSSVYMPLCAVSEDAEYLVSVGLGQAEGNFGSTLYIFRTDSEEICATADLGGQLFYDLRFVADETVAIVGEESVVYYDLSGRLLGEYTYADVYLKDFAHEGDGFLTLSVNMYRAGNRYSLVTLDHTGKEIASLYIGQEILDLSVCEKYIAVLTNSGLTIYDRELAVYAETDDVGTSTSVVMREDGSALLLGSGQGRLYIP